MQLTETTFNTLEYRHSSCNNTDTDRIGESVKYKKHRLHVGIQITLMKFANFTISAVILERKFEYKKKVQYSYKPWIHYLRMIKQPNKHFLFFPNILAKATVAHS